MSMLQPSPSSLTSPLQGFESVIQGTCPEVTRVDWIQLAIEDSRTRDNYKSHSRADVVIWKSEAGTKA